MASVIPGAWPMRIERLRSMAWIHWMRTGTSSLVPATALITTVALSSSRTMPSGNARRGRPSRGKPKVRTRQPSSRAAAAKASPQDPHRGSRTTSTSSAAVRSSAAIIARRAAWIIAGVAVMADPFPSRRVQLAPQQSVVS